MRYYNSKKQKMHHSETLSMSRIKISRINPCKLVINTSKIFSHFSFRILCNLHKNFFVDPSTNWAKRELPIRLYRVLLFTKLIWVSIHWCKAESPILAGVLPNCSSMYCWVSRAFSYTQIVQNLIECLSLIQLQTAEANALWTIRIIAGYEAERFAFPVRLSFILICLPFLHHVHRQGLAPFRTPKPQICLHSTYPMCVCPDIVFKLGYSCEKSSLYITPILRTKNTGMWYLLIFSGISIVHPISIQFERGKGPRRVKQGNRAAASQHYIQRKFLAFEWVGWPIYSYWYDPQSSMYYAQSCRSSLHKHKYVGANT